MSSLLSIISVFDKFNEYLAALDIQGISKIMPSGEDTYPFSATINGDVLAFKIENNKVDLRFTSVLVEKSMVLTTLVDDTFLMKIERSAKNFNHFVTFEQETGIIFTSVWTMNIPLSSEAIDDYSHYVHDSVVMASLLRSEIKDNITDHFRLLLN